MEIIKELSIFKSSCAQFIAPKRINYSLYELLLQLHNFPTLSMQTIVLPVFICEGDHKEHNTVTLHLICHRESPSLNCLIYLHGLGSYSFEGKFLLPYISQHFSLCLFDSRAHGHSRAQTVTFGLLQSIELACVMKKLGERGLRNIALWGRSMGAVTALKTARDYINPSLVYIVADSPFSSFMQIGAEIINRQTGLPLFLANIVISAFQEQIQTTHSLDLTKVNVAILSELNVPISFLYSSIDELIKAEHTELIFNNYNGPKDKNDLCLQHNDPRSPQLISTLIRKIHRAFKQANNAKAVIFKTLPKKKNGLSLTKQSFMSKGNQIDIDKQNENLFQKQEQLLFNNKNKVFFTNNNVNLLYQQQASIQKTQQNLNNNKQKFVGLINQSMILNNEKSNAITINLKPKIEKNINQSRINNIDVNLQHRNFRNKENRIYSQQNGSYNAKKCINNCIYGKYDLILNYDSSHLTKEMVSKQYIRPINMAASTVKSMSEQRKQISLSCSTYKQNKGLRLKDSIVIKKQISTNCHSPHRMINVSTRKKNF